METKKFIRHTLIGASILGAVVISGGCSSNDAPKHTAKSIAITEYKIEKVEKNPFLSSCTSLKKVALFEMRRGERSYPLGVGNNLIAINHEMIANNLLKIYSLKKCNEKQKLK